MSATLQTLTAKTADTTPVPVQLVFLNGPSGLAPATTELDCNGNQITPTNPKPVSDINNAVTAGAMGTPSDAAWTTGNGTAIALLKAAVNKLAGISSVGGGGGGGGAATVADGADAAQGTTTDAVYSGSGAGTVVSLLKWAGASLAAISAKLASSIAVTAASLPLPTGAAMDGTDATGVTQLAGGVGVRGWLSSSYSELGQIYARLSGTLAVSAASLPLPANAAVESGGNLAAILTALGSIYTKLTSSVAVTGTFWQTTQPVSVSTAPVLVAGSAVIGKVGLDTGNNIVGAMGSLNSATVVTPSVAGGAYTNGMCIGGLQPLNNFFRTAARPSATLAQLMYMWASGNVTPVTFFIFSRAPSGSSVFTDNGTFYIAPADRKYLVCPPIPLIAAPVTGDTGAYASITLSLPILNNDTTPGTTLYVATAIIGSTTVTAGDLSYTLSAVLD